MGLDSGLLGSRVLGRARQDCADDARGTGFGRIPQTSLAAVISHLRTQYRIARQIFHDGRQLIHVTATNYATVPVVFNKISSAACRFG
jgi:hypothetical protein